jgi:ketosteroid isomerase-like protein
MAMISPDAVSAPCYQPANDRSIAKMKERDMGTLAEDAGFSSVMAYKDCPIQAEETARNRAMVLAAFDALVAGDGGPFGALFDPGVVFHEAACLPYGGAHAGLEVTMQAHGQIHRLFDRLHPQVEQVLAAGDLVIAYLQLGYRVRKNGRCGRFPVAELYRFREGRIVEWRAHYFDSRFVAGELAADGQPAADSGTEGPPLLPILRYRETGDAPPVAARNRAILVDALDAAAAGAEANFWSIYDPDAVFHEADCLPYGGAHRGLDAVKAGFARIYQAFDRIHARFDQILVAGDIALAYQQIDFRVRGNGRTGSFPVAELFRFRDGKVIEWRALYFDADMVARAISGD